MHKKEKSYFGGRKPTARQFGKGLKTGGKILNIGGKALLYAGAGVPELIPIGAGAIELGAGLNKGGSILKKITKKKKKNNK